MNSTVKLGFPWCVKGQRPVTRAASELILLLVADTPQSKQEKPYKVEVFEDSLYVSTLQTNNILKLNKFGVGNITYLVQGLNRASDILIVQENKQHKDLDNPCLESPCHDTALCLLAPGTVGRSCLCPDGLVKTLSNNTTSQVVCKEGGIKFKTCELNCNLGTCHISTEGPICICPSLYDGDRCQHYRCSHYCQNKGMCYADQLSPRTSESSAPPIKCNCPPNWTGERCETPVRLCEGHCLNNGTCFMPRPTIAQCHCLPGFTGNRCENCVSLLCRNGGICSKSGNVERCICPAGYHGTRCEKSDCDNYCSKVLLYYSSANVFMFRPVRLLGPADQRVTSQHQRGSCTLTSQGPVCVCPPGLTGKKCDQDSCENHCQNGGKYTFLILITAYILRRGHKEQKQTQHGSDDERGTLVWEGVSRSTEVSNYSMFCIIQGGTCKPGPKKLWCSCLPQYTGRRCETNLCNCTCDGANTSCKCLSARDCEDNSVRKCHPAFCSNGGTCSVVQGKPTCRCPPLWGGALCDILLGRNNSCDHLGYCLNGGVCLQGASDNLVCQCAEGWTGVRCEDKASCAHFCFNGGTCQESPDPNFKPSCIREVLQVAVGNAQSTLVMWQDSKSLLRLLVVYLDPCGWCQNSDCSSVFSEVLL
uniref:EGF-like domain-containing protein n=1 Tax=Timema monikensis TaxID=170555 RepID=A0A7R9HV29_9NEOP|nr:unnamed protein product [Timema monikensis]